MGLAVQAPTDCTGYTLRAPHTATSCHSQCPPKVSVCPMMHRISRRRNSLAHWARSFVVRILHCGTHAARRGRHTSSGIASATG
eukprot:scaffold137403_cov33-Tisochrysis_lutea.AAC.2